MRPRRASPAAMPTIVCSVIPVSINRLPMAFGTLRTSARFSAVITMIRSSSNAVCIRSSSYVMIALLPYYQCFRFNICFYMPMQLFQQLGNLRGGEAAKPAVGPCLDAGQALAPHGIGDDHLHLAALRRLAKSLFQLPEVMAIHPGDGTAKGQKFIGQRFQRNQFLRPDIRLELIAVYHHRQVIQPIGIRHQDRFPYATLVELAITRDHDDPVVRQPQFAIEGDTGSHRGKMPERTGMELDTGDLPVRMPV